MVRIVGGQKPISTEEPKLSKEEKAKQKELLRAKKEAEYEEISLEEEPLKSRPVEDKTKKHNFAETFKAQKDKMAKAEAKFAKAKPEKVELPKILQPTKTEKLQSKVIAEKGDYKVKMSLKMRSAATQSKVALAFLKETQEKVTEFERKIREHQTNDQYDITGLKEELDKIVAGSQEDIKKAEALNNVQAKNKNISTFLSKLKGLLTLFSAKTKEANSIEQLKSLTEKLSKFTKVLSEDADDPEIALYSLDSVSDYIWDVSDDIWDV